MSARHPAQNMPGKTFSLLHPLLSFTIPRAWWEQSGAWQFVRPPGQECYVWRERKGARIVPLQSVWPLVRNPGTHEESYGLRNGPLNGAGRGGLLDMPQAMIVGTALEPVSAVLLTADLRHPPALNETRLQIIDGYHRFYASHVLGFTILPYVVTH